MCAWIKKQHKEMCKWCFHCSVQETTPDMDLHKMAPFPVITRSLELGKTKNPYSIFEGKFKTQGTHAYPY